MDPQTAQRAAVDRAGQLNAGAATIVEAKWTEDGRPQFDAGDFKELEARQRGPDVLTEQEMGMVAEAKDAGNEQFKAGSINDALALYNKALEVFADRRGGPTQRVEKSKLCANRAECLLRLKKWEAAMKSATIAIQLDATNAKARFRRAKALEALGGENNLKAALDDLDALQQIDPTANLGKAESTLQAKVHQHLVELREVRRRDAGGLRKAFADGAVGLSTEADDVAAATGTLDLTDVTPSAPPPEACKWCAQLEEAGLTETARYAWLVDVYRTHVDDSASRGEAHTHGLRALHSSPGSIVLDFLIFCQLTVARGVVSPAHWPWWTWDALLDEAGKMISKMFNPEVCHAELRYGPTFGQGGCLRAVGGRVYDERKDGAISYDLVKQQMTAVCWQDGGVDDDGRHRHMFTFDRAPEAFGPVGGALPWKMMLRRVSQSPPFG